MEQLSFFAASAGALPPTFIEPHNPEPACRTAPTQLVRARRTDPATSHEAAAGSVAFAGSHCDRIARGLEGVRDATPHELTRSTGLTVVQIDRRLPEMEGRARVVMVDGKPLQRGGARVWERC